MHHILFPFLAVAQSSNYSRRINNIKKEHQRKKEKEKEKKSRTLRSTIHLFVDCGDPYHLQEILDLN